MQRQRALGSSSVVQSNHSVEHHQAMCTALCSALQQLESLNQLDSQQDFQLDNQLENSNLPLAVCRGTEAQLIREWIWCENSLA